MVTRHPAYSKLFIANKYFLRNKYQLALKLQYFTTLSKPNNNVGMHRKVDQHRCGKENQYKSMNKLRHDFKICIGNGKKTKILEEPWITELPLSKWPTFINIMLLVAYNSKLNLKRPLRSYLNLKWSELDIVSTRMLY
ncbi:ribonuclease H protein [Canna indica]|uniref:Ribonuclease H protein n=1 Tax=Canna indica TaxID=4628 RepID=A0AAQ3Q6W9_9LILI|nr:ribonuclease H protein [Canna indica]